MRLAAVKNYKVLKIHHFNCYTIAVEYNSFPK